MLWESIGNWSYQDWTFTCMFQSLTPTSTRERFKYLRSFKENKYPSKLHWISQHAANNHDIADLFNRYFSSVYSSAKQITFKETANPNILLSAIQLSVTSIEYELSVCKPTFTSNDPLPFFSEDL